MLTLVALLLVQARTVVPPAVMMDGVAVRVTDSGDDGTGGGAGAATVTVTGDDAVPPAPVAVIL